MTVYGYSRELHVGVRNEKNGKLLRYINEIAEMHRTMCPFLAVHQFLLTPLVPPFSVPDIYIYSFISGVPALLSVEGEMVRVVEVNFL